MPSYRREVSGALPAGVDAMGLGLYIPPSCKAMDTVQMRRSSALKQTGGEISKHLATVEHATTSTEFIGSIP